MNIYDWLMKFKKSWEDKDIDAATSLFSDDVIYYETPFQKLNGLDEIKKEWAVIKNQNAINLKYEIFLSDKNKHTVKWELKYLNIENKQQHFAGVYLIVLNELGQCIEFRQYCENIN